MLITFSSHVIIDHKKSQISQGLNLTVPPKHIRYAEYLLPFELLYRDINLSTVSDFVKDCINARLGAIQLLRLHKIALFDPSPLLGKVHIFEKETISY